MSPWLSKGTCHKQVGIDKYKVFSLYPCISKPSIILHILARGKTQPRNKTNWF